MIRMKPTDAFTSLWLFIPQCIAKANEAQQEVFLEFNGTVVRVYPGSHEYDIADKWGLQRCLDQERRGGA